jgi:hypothetical protein
MGKAGQDEDRGRSLKTLRKQLVSRRVIRWSPCNPKWRTCDGRRLRANNARSF